MKQKKQTRSMMNMDPLKPADYNTPTKKKRLVESQCRRMLEAVEAVNPDAQSFLEAPTG